MFTKHVDVWFIQPWLYKMHIGEFTSTFKTTKSGQTRSKFRNYKRSETAKSLQTRSKFRIAKIYLMSVLESPGCIECKSACSQNMSMSGLYSPGCIKCTSANLQTRSKQQNRFRRGRNFEITSALKQQNRSRRGRNLQLQRYI